MDCNKLIHIHSGRQLVLRQHLLTVRAGRVLPGCRAPGRATQIDARHSASTSVTAVRKRLRAHMDGKRSQSSLKQVGGRSQQEQICHSTIAAAAWNLITTGVT